MKSKKPRKDKTDVEKTNILARHIPNFVSGSCWLYLGPQLHHVLTTVLKSRNAVPLEVLQRVSTLSSPALVKFLLLPATVLGYLVPAGLMGLFLSSAGSMAHQTTIGAWNMYPLLNSNSLHSSGRVLIVSCVLDRHFAVCTKKGLSPCRAGS